MPFFQHKQQPEKLIDQDERTVAQQQSGRIVAGKDEKRVAGGEPDGEGIDLRAGGGAADVVDPRLGDIAADLAQTGGAQVPVHIFQVGEKIGIKESDLLQHLPAVQGRTAAGAEHLARMAIAVVIGFQGPQTVAGTAPQEPFSSPVQQVALVVVDHFRGKKIGRPVRGRLDQMAQAVAVELGIVVEQKHQRRAPRRDPPVDRGAEAGVFRQGQQLHFRETLAQQGKRAIA